MSTLAASQHQDSPLAQWLRRLDALTTEVSAWATDQNWSVLRQSKVINESPLGTYEAPALRIRTPQGEIHLEPVALNVIGADGRVDISAWPSLNRVRLVGRPAGWEVVTDFNIPLREPWGRETFIRLAADLTAEP